MNFEPRIRNEDRFAFREGRFDEIAPDILKLLEEKYAHEKGIQTGKEGRKETPKAKEVKE